MSLQFFILFFCFHWLALSLSVGMLDRDVVLNERFVYRADYTETNVGSAITSDSLKTPRELEDGLGCCDDPHIMKVDRDAFAR